MVRFVVSNVFVVDYFAKLCVLTYSGELSR